jgi:hypothetical protein
MGAAAFTRWRAAGVQLLVCIAIAAAAVALMRAVWYPGPLFEAAGGAGLLYILVGVSVVIGPLLTLIVFKPGKRGMKFDLVAIGLVQALALLYGAHMVALARPAFIVFVKDRFELATAAELDPRELAAAKYAQYRSPPWNGPLFAAADFPADPAERTRLVAAAIAGLDLQHFPRYYVPYAERTAQVLARASTIPRLRATEPAIARMVDDYLVRSATPEGEVRCLLLRARFAWIAVLIDPVNAQPKKMLLGEKIPHRG